jgi:hypothetical protein
MRLYLRTFPQLWKEMEARHGSFDCGITNF